MSRAEELSHGETAEMEPLNVDKLWELFVNQVQVNAPEAVIREACAKLAEAGIDQEYQLLHVPPEFLKEVLPPPEYIKHYLATVHVQKKLQDYQRPTDPQAKSTAALERVAEEMRRARLGANNDSDSEVELKDFDCMGSLSEYGLHLPHNFLPPNEKMKSAAKQAAKQYKKKRPFLVEGELTEFVPMWMRDVPKKDQMQTHAHWVSAFWARAMAQLAAQGTADKETVSVSDLLVLFLKLNRMAIENSGRVAWTYDSEHWGALVDRIKRRDPDLNIAKEFLELPHGEKQRVIEKVSTRKQQQQQQDKPQRTRYQQQFDNNRPEKRKRDHSEPQQQPLEVYNDDLPWMRGNRQKGKGGGGKGAKGGKGGGAGKDRKGQAASSQSVKKEQQPKK
jgi:hypothetical protein